MDSLEIDVLDEEVFLRQHHGPIQKYSVRYHHVGNFDMICWTRKVSVDGVISVEVTYDTP